MKRLLSFLRSSEFLCIAAVFLLAAAVRMLYLYEIHDNPFFRHLMLDESSYDRWARRIAAGEWLGKQIFYQDPLYPYFLGAIYSVIGRDFLWVRVIQLLLGSVTCVFIYLLGTSFFDRKTGVAAGVIAALYRPFFYFEAMFLKTFLAVFLLCALLLLLVWARSRRWFLSWVGAGFVLGLLALVRANTLAFAGGVVLWLLVTNRETEGLRRKLITAAGFFAGLMIVLGSVCARNYIVGKDVVLLTSQAGQNFFIGNNPWNHNGRYQPPIYVRPHPRYEQEDFLVRAEMLAGRKLKASEASAFWFGKALHYIEQKPEHWLRLTWTKFRLFWNWYEVPDNQSFYFFSQYSRLLRLPLPNFHAVAALGLTGMVLCLGRWRKLLLLYFAVILYSATVVAFYVFGRYRLPVVPPLILFATAAAMELPAMIARKRYFKLAATAALAALFLALLGMDVNPKDYVSDRANAFCRVGDVYLMEKKLDDALSAYERARKIAPQYWAAYFGLGQTHERRHEFEAALENYELAKKLNPGIVDPYIRMGGIYFRTLRYEKSAEQYRKALKYKPDQPDLHRKLANIYKILGDEDRARAHLRKLHELDILQEPQE